MFTKTPHSKFKTEVPLEARLAESKRIKSKYPDRVPIICERHTGSSDNVPGLDKNRYLVPEELTVGQFLYVVRQRLNLSSEQAIFLFTANNVLPPTSKMLRALYAEFQDEDGFLYLFYSSENAFG